MRCFLAWCSHRCEYILFQLMFVRRSRNRCVDNLHSMQHRNNSLISDFHFVVIECWTSRINNNVRYRYFRSFYYCLPLVTFLRWVSNYWSASKSMERFHLCMLCVVGFPTCAEIYRWNNNTEQQQKKPLDIRLACTNKTDSMSNKNTVNEWKQRNGKGIKSLMEMNTAKKKKRKKTLKCIQIVWLALKPMQKMWQNMCHG